MGEVRDREAGEEPEPEDEGVPPGDGEPLDERAPAPLPPLEPSVLIEVLEFVARGLVDSPDGVRVEMAEREGGVTLRLFVDQPDMGKVIGRSGRTARALRTLMRAAGVRAGVNTFVEIVEQGEQGDGSPG